MKVQCVYIVPRVESVCCAAFVRGFFVSLSSLSRALFHKRPLSPRGGAFREALSILYGYPNLFVATCQRSRTGLSDERPRSQKQAEV